jgi:NAD(P)-dependent dehydrogenase (short-subunit alcohol dehydrogenase family)
MGNRLQGRTALITGGGSGLGAAIARRFAEEGAIVFPADLNEASAKGVAAECDKVTPGAAGLAVDVADSASVKKMFAELAKKTKRLDVLVNNAGIGLLGGAEESSISQVQALFDVNLFGVMRVTNAVLPSMRQRGQGRIINISSVLGFMPAPYSAHYSATKHALEGYSESLDHEIRAFNIRVSLIEPAYTRSVFEQNALEPDSVLKEYDEARAGARALLQDVMTTADPPKVVADAVLLAATAARPRRRYPAGKIARQVSLLRRFAPAEIFDKSLRKQMRLPV